jgi:nucleolar protein 58
VVAKDIKDQLAVPEAKLGTAIKEKLGIPCIYDASVQELMRGIRSQISALIAGLKAQDMTAMTLGLSHSLSRYKLKFSPDKVDTMIVQAIALLDDLDKELNTYTMRVREWYGWHFPELSKMVTDNQAYVRTILAVGKRTNFATTDLSEVLPEEIEEEVKEAAEISMGTEISDEDILHVKQLAEQVLAITEYRAQLYDYLKNRMNAVAPNLTIMVGELVGARLIAHAGSLLNLAKHPASTVQILGAEKALFRALKTKHDTPKYGLLYHASVVGQSQPKNKGKMSRVLAAKTSLVARVDALADESNPDIGLELKARVEARLRQLEGGEVVSATKSGVAVGPSSIETSAPVRSYNDATDNVMDSTADEPNGEKPKKKKKEKEGSIKKKKKTKRSASDADGDGSPEAKKSKKKKKKSKSDSE